MCARYPNATSMKVSGPSIHWHALKAISSLRYVGLQCHLCGQLNTYKFGWFVTFFVRNLEAITLGKGHIADDFFESITSCPMLQRLDIKYCTLGNGVPEIAHDRLRHLLLTKCRLARISIRWRKFITLLQDTFLDFFHHMFFTVLT